MSVFLFSLDLDIDNISEMSENEISGCPGNEADTLTQSMPQAINCRVN